MLSSYKKYFETRLQATGKALSWLNPNTLTLIGIIPQALFFILMRNHHYGWAALALALSAIDMLDGVVARANNKVTPFGGFLDSTLDRISDFLIIAAFYAAGLISVNLTAALLVITYLISYVRSRAELATSGQIKFDIGLIERPERIIYLFLVVITQAIWSNASLTSELVLILTILSLLTLVQRIWVAYKKL